MENMKKREKKKAKNFAKIEGRCCLPHDLLVFSLPGLDLQALVVHLMNVASSLHVAQDIILQLRHRLQGVGYILELLNVADHLGCLCPLGKVDKVGLLDDGRDTILNEGKIREVDTCERQLAPRPVIQAM